MQDLNHFHIWHNEFIISYSLKVYRGWGLCALDNTIDEFIRNNLGEKTLQKIEKRLFEKYKISINQALAELEMLHTVLREFFGDGAEGLEIKILQNSNFSLSS